MEWSGDVRLVTASVATLGYGDFGERAQGWALYHQSFTLPDMQTYEVDETQV